MKQKELPEIRISDAWLFRENVSKHLHELWAKKGERLADDKYMEKVVKAYQKAWKPHEKEILTAMCDVLDLTFRQNIVDVYIAPWFSAFSNPLVVGVKYKPDYFIDVLTHELIHRLLTDNTDMTDSYKLKNEWIKMFGKKHSFKTRIHIPVHAVLKYIYLDVLNEPQRLERDMEECKKWEGYSEAWDYVNAHDYKEIIENLKQSYKKLAQQ